jgi:hypothetical protein
MITSSTYGTNFNRWDGARPMKTDARWFYSHILSPVIKYWNDHIIRAGPRWPDILRFLWILSWTDNLSISFYEHGHVGEGIMSFSPDDNFFDIRNQFQQVRRSSEQDPWKQMPANFPREITRQLVWAQWSNIEMTILFGHQSSTSPNTEISN